MSIARSLRISDYLTIGGMIAASVLFISSTQASQQREVDKVNNQLQIMTMKIESLQRNQTSVVTMDRLSLWVERARQANDLRSLPSVPSE